MSGAGTPWRLVHYGLDGRAKLLRISHIGTRSFFFPRVVSCLFFFAFPCCIESSRVYDWLLLVQFSIGGLCESTLGGFFFLSFLFFSSCC